MLDITPDQDDMYSVAASLHIGRSFCLVIRFSLVCLDLFSTDFYFFSSKSDIIARRSTRLPRLCCVVHFWIFLLFAYVGQYGI